MVLDLRHLEDRTASAVAASSSAVATAASAARLRYGWRNCIDPLLVRFPQPLPADLLPQHRSAPAPHGAVPLMLANAASEATLSRLHSPVEEGETWA